MGPKAVRDVVHRIAGLLSRRRHAQPPPTRSEELLAYRFHDSELLQRALTHKSALPQGEKAWLRSNERLEFLGDAVLNCLVTEYLFSRYPERTEGQLSKIKSLVVSRRVLGQCAARMGLGEHLILGSSERKSGGRSRRSLVSNAFEAVLGAIYLDGGLDSARHFLEQHLFCHIDEFVGSEEYVNYKSLILEMSQRDGFGIPRYVLVKTTGPDHAMQFRMRVEVAGVALGEGSGPNKKTAEQQAAYMATMNYDKDTILSQLKGAEQ
ncbi:MAG: ribonuclease III [Chitinivibrionales bacterium]|nr:ribonuclease III [Chitinivibrionales bacterium]